MEFIQLNNTRRSIFLELDFWKTSFGAWLKYCENWYQQVSSISATQIWSLWWLLTRCRISRNLRSAQCSRTSCRQRSAINAYSLLGQRYPNKWDSVLEHKQQHYYVVNMQICIYSVILNCKGMYWTQYLNDYNLHSQWISLYPSHISVCELLLIPQVNRSQHAALHVYIPSDLSIDSSAS